MANLRRQIPQQTESLFAENHETFFNSIGQSLHFCDVRVEPACTPIATAQRTSREVGSGPRTDITSGNDQLLLARLVDPFPHKLRSLCGVGRRTRCRVLQFVAHELELPLLVSSLPVGERAALD